MTVDTIVVSLKNVKTPGQAYVALSRVTSLSGLYLSDFNHSNIFCDDEVLSALTGMPRQQTSNCNQAGCNMSKISFVCHNVEGLLPHFADVETFVSLHTPTVFMITETWLSERIFDDIVKLKNYNVQRCDRNVQDNSLQKGGVAIYTEQSVRVSRINIPCEIRIEAAAIQLHYENESMISCVIYRRPSSNVIFCEHLNNLLQFVNRSNTDAIITGDFNEDLISENNHRIENVFLGHGYIQVIHDATTRGNTLLDAAYIRVTKFSHSSNIIATYFSYHEAIRVSLYT